MSYRNPKIIDDKSGLIVPQALIATGEKISAAFGAELARQHKETQLLNKEISQKGYRINDDTQKKIDALNEKGMKGSKEFVNSFRETQTQLIKRSGSLAVDIMTAEMRGASPKKIAELKKERDRVQVSIGSMNQSFIKAGVIGETTSELNTAGNSKLGNTQVYTNSDQMIEAQAITGAPNTSALYGLDENYNPVINITGQKMNSFYFKTKGQKSTRFGGVGDGSGVDPDFKMGTIAGKSSGSDLGSLEKKIKEDPNKNLKNLDSPDLSISPTLNYEKSMNIASFNDDRYKPISDITDTSSAAIAKTAQILTGSGKGKINDAFLENETFDVVAAKGKKRAGTRKIEIANQQTQGTLSTAVEEIMTQIESTKGMPNQTNFVLKNHYAINDEMIEAYKDINNPKHDEAVDLVRYSVATKRVAPEFGLKARLIPTAPGNADGYEFYKEGAFKEDPKPTGTVNKDNIEFNRLKKRFDSLASTTGPIDTATFDKAITDAFNVGRGMEIKKAGTGTYVQVKEARVEGNKLIINYKGIPTTGEAASMGDVDQMVLDLSNTAQLFNSIGALTRLNPSNQQKLTDYIMQLKNRQ